MVIEHEDDKILIYCDLCNKKVFASNEASTTEIFYKKPYIHETYKVYCEYCYMVPLLKIKELTGILEEKSKLLEKKYTRRKRTIGNRVKKEKQILDDINHNFY